MGARLFVPYGSERTDTAGVCGDTDNGFGLLWNYNELGDGPHMVTLYVDGVLTTQVDFTVRTLGTPLLSGNYIEWCPTFLEPRGRVADGVGIFQT